MTDHTFVDRVEVGYDCACGWSGTYSRDVHFDTAADQHADHLTRILPPAECSCAMTEGSQRRCPAHGEDAYVLSPGSGRTS